MDTLLERDDANGVCYRIMTPQDAAAVTAVMANAFFEGEPVTAIGGGATLSDMMAFCQMYVPRMADEGNVRCPAPRPLACDASNCPHASCLTATAKIETHRSQTVLAVDVQSHEVLGAFLNEDFANTDPPEFESFLAQADGIWSPCLTMIEELEVALSERFAIPPSNRASGRWFHLWMLGVAPNGRGRGVGKKLAAHSVRWAKARGFELAFAECTGALSTHIVHKLGAERIAFLDYAAWQGEHAETLRGLPALGHPGMSMLAVGLKEPYH